jgi:hypothetical protein
MKKTFAGLHKAHATSIGRSFPSVMQSDLGKTNQEGNRVYMGAMRHRNPMLYTIGALAQYRF